MVFLKAQGLIPAMPRAEKPQFAVASRKRGPYPSKRDPWENKPWTEPFAKGLLAEERAF